MKTLFKTLLLSVRKLPAMAGSGFALLLSLVTAFIMFFAAYSALNAKTPTSLKIACVNNDRSALASELISSITNANGSSVELTVCAAFDEAEKLSAESAVEGVLVICEDLEDNLKRGKSAFEYYPSNGASSAQAVRELIAGEAVTIGSRLRSEEYFESLTGRSPSDAENLELRKAFEAALAAEGSAVTKETVLSSASLSEKPRETNLFSAFFARYSGFTSFVIMLILLMLGAFCGSLDERRSFERIAAIKHGRWMGFFSNLFALLIFGALLLAVSFIPSGKAGLLQFASGSAYIFCCASLAILLGSLSSTARAELASPLIAFLTSLAGGCFTDLSALGAGFKTLSRFTPQGQYLSALNGEKLFIPVLFAVGLLFLLLATLLTRAASRADQAR